MSSRLKAKAPAAPEAKATTRSVIFGEVRRDYFPITVSSGQAENEIMPDSVFAFEKNAFEIDHLLQYINFNQETINEHRADEREAVAAMLCVLTTTTEQEEKLDRLNRLLADVELPFEVNRRGDF